MQLRLLVLTIGVLSASLGWAAAPAFRTNTCPVTIDGTRVGTDLTADGSSLRNTIAYESATKLYHFWGFTADDPDFPSAASALEAVVHATSTDGTHFISDGHLSYGVGSANYADYGATIDPPLNFFRAAYQVSSGTWKLFNWSENDQQYPSRWGQYDYNTSVNDLGSVASNTAVVHQGPLLTPVAGNHVGAFGLVDGELYLRVDNGGLGGAGQFDYTDAIPASTTAEKNESDLFAGTPYCWELTAIPPPPLSTDPPTCANPALLPAYVHNVGRTLRQTDGTLGTYYAFRVITDSLGDSVRADKQVWYVESNDNGATWSAPVGLFADGNTVTVAEQPIATTTVDGNNGNFSSVEMVQVASVSLVYFSTQDTAGKYIFVSSHSQASDTLFADDFEGCGD